jgi:hypothetical protein
MKKFSWHKFYKFPTGHTLRSECEYPYKPPMKGRHRQNYKRNALERKLNKSKESRKRCHNYFNKGYVYKFFCQQCPRRVK